MAIARRHILGAAVRWKQLELAAQYVLASAVAIVLIAVLLGWSVSAALSRHEINERTLETGLFLGGVFSILLQGLAENGLLAEGETERLNALMQDPRFASRFPYLEVWLPNGQIAYSNSSVLMGLHLDLPEQARQAFEGVISSSFSDLQAEEHRLRNIVSGLLEVYAPVRALGSSDIFAVVEIHEAADSLNRRLREITLLVWIFAISGAIAAILSLSGIVLKASRTMRLQRSDLARRATSARLAEQRLKLAGADLHDGPSQLISYALLQVHEAGASTATAQRDRALRSVRASLITAQGEIRSIGQGIVLPELADLSLDEIIDACIAAHRKRTGDSVVRQGALGHRDARLELRIGLYRVVQEGLTNAYRHAQAPGTKLEAFRNGDAIRIRVFNRAGPAKPQQEHELSGMGLEGIRARVESLGGSVTAGHVDELFCLDVTLNVGHHDQ